MYTTCSVVEPMPIRYSAVVVEFHPVVSRQSSVAVVQFSQVLLHTEVKFRVTSNEPRYTLVFFYQFYPVSVRTYHISDDQCPLRY